MNTKELWKTVLGEIEVQISRPNFLTWLNQSQLVEKDEKNGAVLVGLPNHFAKDWVKSRYHKLILGSLRSLDGSVKSVQYVVINSDTAQTAQKKMKKKSSSSASSSPQEPLLELRVDPKTNLNPRYSLNAFIVGSSNELAHAAIQAVIADVGTKYNPLFIYGGVGLGKTHLIQGAGNAIGEQYAKKVRVLYVTSEKFINDVVWALRNRRMDDVKSKYRDVDVLVIDDIQFIGGKAATEQEFFYTFNTLYEHNKQIIISSDRPPSAIPTLEERLRSRFEGGMIVDVSYPDYEMRLAILKTKAGQQNISLDEEIFQHIALKIQNNIRELEGVLNKVIFTQQYKGEKITKQKVDEVIQEITNTTSKNINVQDVIKTVADFFEISTQDLTNRSRRKEVVGPRQICMYLLRDMLHLSYPHIGEKLGKRDHTTAIHAYEKIVREIAKDPQLNQRITLIRDRLQKA